MYCIKCGQELRVDSKVCFRCGVVQNADQVDATKEASSQTYVYESPYNYTPPKKPFTSDKRDKIFIVVAAILGFLFCEFVLWGGWGVSIPIYIGLFYAAVMFYFRDKEKLLDKSGLLLFLPIVLLSVCFALYSNALLKSLNVMLLFVLINYQLAIFTGITRYPVFSLGSLGDASVVVFELPFSNIDAPFKAAAKKTEDSNGSKTFGKVLLGIVLALPVAIIIIALLTSADEAFAKVMGSLDDILFNRMGEYIAKIIVGLFVAIPLYSLYYAMRYKMRRNLDKEAAIRMPDVMDPVIINTALGVLIFIFVVYVLAQLQYFSGSFINNRPQGVIFADYAKRGFYELVTVTVINLFVSVMSAVLVRKKDNLLPKSFKGFTFALAAFTLLLLASAISKMVMYVEAYGLTLLRVYTTWFMLLLALLLIGVFIKLIANKFKIVRFACIAFLVMYMGLNFLNVDALIPAYNIARYQDGTFKTVDTTAFYGLSDSMVPQVIPLLDDKDAKVRSATAALLADRKANLADMQDGQKQLPWQKLNYSTFKAINLINEHSDAIGTAKKNNRYWY